MKAKPKRNGLTERQRRFVSVYLQDLNASEAARAAGYKGDRADQAGHRMKSYPVVKAEIDRQLSIAMGGNISTIKSKVLDELWQQAFDTDGLIEDVSPKGGTITKPNPNKMKALELLAKYAGILTDRVELTGKDGGPIPVAFEPLPGTAKE